MDSYTIYKKSPVFVQNIICSLYGLIERNNRLRGNFLRYFEWLKHSEWFTEEEIKTYQEQQLREIIQYAYDNVPYYRSVFEERNLTPSDVQTIEDLKKLPILEKEVIRSNIQALQANSYVYSTVSMQTSGSTGKALDFLVSKDSLQFRWAVYFRHKARFGINYTDSYATFTGKVAVPIGQEKPPYWRENLPMHQTVFNMHHLTEEKIPFIVERLNRGGFSYYTGYPSIISQLANLIEETGLKIIAPPKVIFTGAEALLEEQSSVMKRVFQCPISDLYGFSEGAGGASKCTCGFYHEDFEFGILECHNPTYNEDGTMTGEILATGFTNLAMPLIRYRVGDTATWGNVPCDCGRKSRTILKIDGRNEDYVITPEGTKIQRFDYIFKETRGIKEAQVVQKELGAIIIRIVRRTEYDQLKVEQSLLYEIRNKISPTIQISFEYVEQIEREKGGKLRAVKSYLE